MTTCSGEKHNIDPVARLGQIERVGGPADILTGSNVEPEVAYGNHSSADKHAIEVWENAMAMSRRGGQLWLRRYGREGTRPADSSSGGVVDEKRSRKIIHSSICSCKPEGAGGAGCGQ